MRDKQVGASERGPQSLDEGWWASVMAQDGGRPALPTEQQAARPQTDPDEDWAHALHLHESDTPIELTVTGFNRGGLLVNLNSLRGFVPASHLLDLPNHLSEDDRREALSLRIGQSLRLKVIEYDRAKGRVVLSERAALAGAGARDQVLDTLEPGQLVSGAVTNLTDFGVFIDLGGIEGLVHISEVSWSRVAHPGDVLQIGQTVQVHVLSIDRAHGRIALSLKRTRPDPWRTVAERYTVGQMISGTVTNVVTFGAFVSVEEGLEGLIHVSELAEGHFLHPRNVVNEGEVIQARILHIDAAARRLSLSLRQAA